MLNKESMLTLSVFAACLLSGCAEEEQVQVMPQVRVENVQVQANSMSFDIVSSDAITCAYLLSRSDEAVEGLPAENILFNGTEVPVNGTARVSVSGLDWNSSYTIKAAAVSISRGYVSDEASFEVYAEPWTELDNPANTYIITDGGYYGFVPKKVDGTPIEIASADWIWATSEETFAKEQNIISEVELIDGVVRFRTLGNEGNAVISGFDASGTVVWSWLIWCTDRPADVQITADSYFMDRVIGATGSTQEEGTKTWSVIMYQYARTSPIFGGYADEWGASEVFNEARKYTVINPAHDFEWTLSGAQMPSQEEADKHPLTFFTGVDNQKDGLWCSAPWDWNYLGLWYGKVTNWKNRERFKTNLDPCPYGYRIPAGSDWGTTAEFMANMEPVGSVDNPIGWNYTYNGQKSWFPCGNAGRIGYSGELSRGFGGNTFLWDSSLANIGQAQYFVSDAFPARWSFAFAGIGWSVETAANPAFAFGIRCVKENDVE